MRTEHPPSRTVEHLWATSFEILSECRLRFAFGQQARKGPAIQTAAALLGTACHNVLDEGVSSGILLLEDWREQVADLWERELERYQGDVDNPRLDGDPRRWAGYQLKRARLLQVAARIRERLGDLPADAQLLTEEPLSGAAGRLYGRPDLIIRSKGVHEIIDYKSGAILDRETKQPRDAYVRQLQLYAYLEHETTGRWPTSAHLFPLSGAPVEINVEGSVCSGLAAVALETLSKYNVMVPTTPLASPAPDHCRWCPYATVCADFWQAGTALWGPEMLFAAGFVCEAFTTLLGGLTVWLDVQAGSVQEQRIVIKNIDPRLYPDARDVTTGDEVAATGLILDTHGAGYLLGSSGLFSKSPANAPKGEH